ncbi:F-box domain, Skp2-like protein [Niveomyces insectorum RCEF 264]|uniref:F-box domain, Skp2-like protein n=1 Tax=Niveomyces insectorum RCEF 264 TaxID=1081102 RepID=A0A168A945_9HYPO|nr:F-box domain, Skp2-like protein [Niveomyces insectorum RCEF 264]
MAAVLDGSAGAALVIPPALATRSRPTFLDLPDETQTEIFSYCRVADLICLSLVSHRFRELAAEQLYHTLDVVFSEEDELRPPDAMRDLPLCLDTLTTSDYDYAKHLREFSFDTENTGIRGENAYKTFHHGLSAGKFLDTLVLLALRKAKRLETLVWNVRIEISRPLYKVLHQIDTLVNVELRLQSGPSLYEGPPALPLASNTPTVSSLSSSSSAATPFENMLSVPPFSQSTVAMQPTGSGFFGTPAPPPVYYAANGSGVSPALSLPKPAVRRVPRRPVTARDPPTISGFKNLKSLGVLDIDSLDVITEIKTCVRNSASTLTELRLSFSENLASKSRKPPAESDTESEPDDDDDFQPFPLATEQFALGMDGSSGPNKAFRAQEEKKNQESALGRIFDLEPYAIKGSKRSAGSAAATATAAATSAAAKTAGADDKDGAVADEAKADYATKLATDFVNSVRTVTSSLLQINGSGGHTSDEQKEALRLIAAAAKKYVDYEEKQADGAANSETKPVPLAGFAPSGSGEGDGDGDNATHLDPHNDEPVEDDDKSLSLESSSLFKDTQVSSKKLKDIDRDVCPEDIDIEEPEGQLVLDPHGGSFDKDTENQTDFVPALVVSSVSDNPGQADEHTASSPDTSKQDDNDVNEQTQKQSHFSEKNKQQDSLQSQDITAATTMATEPTAASQLPLFEVPSTRMAKLASNLAAQKANYQVLLDRLSMVESLSRRMSEKVEGISGAGGNALDVYRIAEVEKQVSAFRTDVGNIYQEVRSVEAEINDIEKQIGGLVAASHAAGGTASTIAATSAAATATTATATAAATATTTNAGRPENNRRLISDYVRSTRGLALETLAVHLIPVKASVLSKAIDLRALKTITLLNVGPQAPVWTLLAKENKLSPLPLRTIFTDNVSNAFLHFVAQLDEVRNLYMLERDSVYRPESFASKTTATIDHIRRLVLRKHAPHLRRLMIQNQDNNSWDMDEATVDLLSKRAPNLGELSVSMNMQSIHAFLQCIYGYTSLVALHVIHLRNDDTCVWVMRETKRFLIDMLSHHPHLKLEYLAIDSNNGTVERIVRVDARKEREKRQERRRARMAKAKGKTKATTSPAGIGINTGTGGIVSGNGWPEISSLPSSNIWNTNSSSYVGNMAAGFLSNSGGMHHYGSDDNRKEEDDEDDEEDSDASGNNHVHARRKQLKVKMMRMSDVWDVAIFRKEIMTGIL